MAKRPKNSAPSRADQAANARAKSDKAIRAATLKLQKRGFVYPGKDIRNKPVTRYERERTKALKGVLDGTLQPVATKGAGKGIRGDKGLERSKGHVFVPVEKGERARVQNGAIVVTRKNRDGSVVRRMRLPVDAHSPAAVREFIESGQAEAARGSDEEYFAFRIQGYPSLQVHPDTQSILDTINHYRLFSGPYDDAPITFELVAVYPPEAWETMVAQERSERRAVREREHADEMNRRAALRKSATAARREKRNAKRRKK